MASTRCITLIVAVVLVASAANGFAASSPLKVRSDQSVTLQPSAGPGAPVSTDPWSTEETVVAAASRLPEGFEVRVFAGGLKAPTAVVAAPDGRFLVAEQGGRLRIIRDGELLAAPMLELAVNYDEERGLVGVTLDPRFDRNGHVYVYYTRTADEETYNRVSRFTVSAADPDAVDPASERILLDRLPAAKWHNGGAIHFGPDGMLYVAVGEALESSKSQALDALNGKLLRLDPSEFPALIPPDNPFIGTAGARGEIWAYGLRNPFVFAFDAVTGALHINDVGSAAWEEINLGRAGANYGWPECEGVCGLEGITDPVYAYERATGCAITGGAFYRGAQFPDEYDGSYFFADFCSRWIKRLTPEGAVVDFAADLAEWIVHVAVGPDGSLYYLTYGNETGSQASVGALYQIRFIGGGNQKPVAVISAPSTRGVAPWPVELAGEDSHDPDGGPLSYRWEFGDGSPAERGSSVRHTYTADGLYRVELTVEDQHGATDASAGRIAVGNPPQGRITAPGRGKDFFAGEVIRFEGIGTDREDGDLPADAYRWWIMLHHHPETHPHHHMHPALPPVEGANSGSYRVPVETHDQDVWYRIHLTVTDSDGLFHHATRDLVPKGTFVTFRTVPPGLQIRLDGVPEDAPISGGSIARSMRQIGVPILQMIGQTGYRFSSWSDGAPATHTITIPDEDTTYTATYAVDPNVDPSLMGVWMFDEGRGAVADDASWNGRRGTLQNGPTWAEGRFGGALSFDGVDDYVETGYEADLARWTVSVWVRSPAKPVEAPASGPVQREGNYRINWNHPDARFRGAAAVIVGERWHAAGFGRLRANRWYHLAATYDGAQLKAYTNGVLVTATPCEGEPDAERETLTFGRHAGAPQFFQGIVDEIRLYARALRDEEVRDLFRDRLDTVLER